LKRELLADQRQHRRVCEVKHDCTTGEDEQRTAGQKHTQTGRLIVSRRLAVAGLGNGFWATCGSLAQIDSLPGRPSMSNFRELDRDTPYVLPPSLHEWPPERHLARFVVEVIDGLDLSAMVTSYRGAGSAGYHPALLLGLLVYGYATGVFSSRKLEQATYDSVAFRFKIRAGPIRALGSHLG
jgi:Transposase domain (DUF772)